MHWPKTFHSSSNFTGNYRRLFLRGPVPVQMIKAPCRNISAFRSRRKQLAIDRLKTCETSGQNVHWFWQHWLAGGNMSPDTIVWLLTFWQRCWQIWFLSEQLLQLYSARWRIGWSVSSSLFQSVKLFNSSGGDRDCLSKNIPHCLEVFGAVTVAKRRCRPISWWYEWKETARRIFLHIERHRSPPDLFNIPM